MLAAIKQTFNDMYKNDTLSPSIGYTYWLFNKQVKNKKAALF